MKKVFKSIQFATVLTAGLLFAAEGYAQTCYDSSILPTTPSTNFTVVGAGMIKDNSTGLVWARCAYGQTWNDSTSACDGQSSEVAWQTALLYANDATLGGFTDWRIPNTKELATIVEKMCVDPSVNSDMFSNTPSGNFWTSTTVFDDIGSAWAITFTTGRNNTKQKLLDLHLRLVRFDN